MSVPMKKRHTSSDRSRGHSSRYLDMIYKGIHYKIPKLIADKYKVSGNSNERENNKTVPAATLFSELYQEYTKAGVLLQGLRHRENLTQIEFAKKINVTQADLSKMENGKRSIGKGVAKRIATLFDVNYRSFLE